MSDIKVYKMNDYEWWASKLSIQETLDFYLKETGLDEEENPLEDIKELDIDKEGMWWQTDAEEDLERLGEHDELVNYETVRGRRIRKPKPGNLMRSGGEVFIFISYREAIQRNGEYKEPYMIASTEW